MGAAIHRTIAPSRITFVDTAKGISILLIVALHANFHPEMLAFVELPLFFILSGIFYSTKLDFKHFLIKKLYTLLWPCLIWQLPSWIYSITYYFLHKEISLIICFKDSPVPTTVWFLWSLFLIQIALYPIVKYKKKWLLPLAIMSYIIGYKLGIMNIYNFLFIPTSLTCLIYFTIGYMCKEIIKKFDKFRTDIIVAVTLMGGAFSYGLYYISSPCFYFCRGNVIDCNIFTLLFIALFGSVGIIGLSVIISRTILNVPFRYFGQNSLIILCTHLYVMKLLGVFVQSSCLMFLITVLLSIPIIEISNNFFPYLFRIKQNEKTCNRR